jgi:FixJ family two-component response regulator
MSLHYVSPLIAHRSLRRASCQLIANTPGNLLPSDLSGIKARALITQIRRRKLNLAIIVVGRNSDLAVAVELVRAGATDFLEQPFSHRDLRAMIRRAMRKTS